MRSRGAYRRQERREETANAYIGNIRGRPVSQRPPNGVSVAFQAVKEEVKEDNDIEMIDISLPHEMRSLSKRRRSVNNSHPIAVITIDSDDDVEELPVHITDSDYSSASTSSSSVVEEKPFSLSPPTKKCRKCLRPLSPIEDEYNRLTSADFYINPRAHPSVIPMELKDKNRFTVFEEAIRHNKGLFVNQTVLVIGSGNGVLPLMVGKAQASTVIVVDKPGIAQLVESVIEKNRRKLPNKRNPTKFFVIRESIDEMVLPNGLQKVDIILSDWANHSLFFKSLIHYFIKARDKFLRAGGLIFPDAVNLYLSAAHDNVHKHKTKNKHYSESLYVKRIDYWDKNVYGFDMTAIKEKVLSEPFHEYIKRSQVITNEFLLKHFDLYHISLNQINFSLPFQLTANKNHYLQMFAIFFDIQFTRRIATDTYSTRPTASKTMFRPTLFFVDFEKHLTLENEDRIDGRFKYSLNEDLTHMSVGIDFQLKNKYFDVKEKLVFSSD